jgi:hypothetical protein
MSDGERYEPGEVVESGSAVGGAIATVAASLVAGPVAGAAGGALLQRALLRVGGEIERRVLAGLRARRVARAVEAVGDSGRARLGAGEQPRADGFFDEQDGESAAGELLEGVLLTAADAWENRKVPYIGNLFAGMSFDPAVSIAESSYFLRLADRLTYRQLALLAFWHAATRDGSDYERAVLSLGVDQDEQGGRPTPALTAEMDDLMRAGMLGVAREGGTVGYPEPTWGGVADVASLRGTDLATVRLTPLGETLYRLMGLDQVPPEDLDDVLAALRGRG